MFEYGISQPCLRDLNEFRAIEPLVKYPRSESITASNPIDYASDIHLARLMCAVASIDASRYAMVSGIDDVPCGRRNEFQTRIGLERSQSGFTPPFGTVTGKCLAQGQRNVTMVADHNIC